MGFELSFDPGNVLGKATDFSVEFANPIVEFLQLPNTRQIRMHDGPETKRFLS